MLISFGRASRQADDNGARRHRRAEVQWPAMVYRKGKIYNCTVLDISVGGARVDLAETLDVATILTVTVERYGDFPAEVVWQRDRATGLRFLESPQTIGKRLTEATDSPDRSGALDNPFAYFDGT